MTENNQAIHQIIKNNKGLVSSGEVTKLGIPRRELSQMVADGVIYRVDRGLYALPEAWEDELYILQYHFARGVFSYETALYLLGFSDRAPLRYTMTFPQGYNTARTKKNIKQKVSIDGLYELGITQAPSPCGNPLKIYNIERTLCDIVKGRNPVEITIVNQAMKQYAQSKVKNFTLLMEYAEKLRVKPKIQNYMEVLL